MARPAVRTCIGCREQVGDDELLRLVRSPDGQVVVDLRRRLPGRGAWVHPQRSCLEQAPRALSRAFKTATKLPAGVVLVDVVREHLLRAATDGLSQAAAAGGIAGGRAAVGQAVAEGRATQVLIASDASDRARRDAATLAGPRPVMNVTWTTDDLGRLTGQAPRAMVAVLGGPATQHLRRQLRRLRQLG